MFNTLGIAIEYLLNILTTSFDGTPKLLYHVVYSTYHIRSVNSTVLDNDNAFTQIDVRVRFLNIFEVLMLAKVCVYEITLSG